MFLFDQKQKEEDSKLSAELLERKDRLDKELLSQKISWETKQKMIADFHKDAGIKVFSDKKSTWMWS